jgi:hypothetical protein
MTKRATVAIPRHHWTASEAAAGSLHHGRIGSSGRHDDFFRAGRNWAAGAALSNWDELPDPLSSFVPELQPRFGGVFFAGGMRQTFPEMGASARPLRRHARDRGKTGFAACCPRSSSRYPGFPLGRAARDVPARCRPRSPGRLRGPDVSWPSPERSGPCSTALHISAKHGRAGSVPKPHRLECDFRQMATAGSILKHSPACFGRFAT